MRCLLSLFWLLFLALGSCQPARPGEVLFIGNSLTYYHDMPGMLQAMLQERGIAINVHQCTEPGVSLRDHLTSQTTLTELNGRQWEYVVLQEGTVRLLIPEVMKYDVIPTVVSFDSLIEKRGGEIILYQSYPISRYPAKYCYPAFIINQHLEEGDYCSVEFLNSEQEFTSIEASFKELIELVDGQVAPIGKYFEICRRKAPELMLFESSEDSHPSKLGSYLIACVFFKVLSGQSASSIKYDAGLDLRDVNTIKEIVDSN